MIAKISTGSDARGLARYLHGPGKATPHTYRDEAGRLMAGGVVIGGTVQVTAQNQERWARDFEQAAAMNRRVQKPVWHCSLRCAPGDRRLTDAEFADVAQTVAERLGYENHPWVAVRHDDDHIHIAVSRVDFQGVTWKNANDRWKVVDAMREVERQHGLVEVASPARARGRQVSSGELRRAVRTGAVPEREQLRQIVTAARDVAAGQGVEAFEQAVAHNPVGPVQVRRNQARTGRMNGYSFHVPGQVDAAGDPVWWPASKLDRGLAWSQLEKVLSGPVPERLATEAAVPRKRLERAASWEQRRREAGAAEFVAKRWAQVRAEGEAGVAQLQAEPGAVGKWSQVRGEFERQEQGDREARAAQAVARAQSVPQARGGSRPSGVLSAAERARREQAQRRAAGRGRDTGVGR